MVRFVGWLDFFFLLLWFMVVASGATLEVVEVAIVVVLVFLVAVGCYGCLWVVVDGGSGLGWVFMGCG